MTHSFYVLPCEAVKFPCKCVRHILHENPEMPLPCKLSRCIASTSVSLTRCCTSTCVFRARSRLLSLLVKQKKKEKKKAVSGVFIMSRLTSPARLHTRSAASAAPRNASCPDNLLSPSLTSDGNCLMHLLHTHMLHTHNSSLLLE